MTCFLHKDNDQEIGVGTFPFSTDIQTNSQWDSPFFFKFGRAFHSEQSACHSNNLNVGHTN